MGGRWAFFSFGVFGFRGVDDGLFSLLACLAFGGRTMGFFLFWRVWLLVGGRWAFFAFGVFGFWWGLFAL